MASTGFIPMHYSPSAVLCVEHFTCGTTSPHNARYSVVKEIVPTLSLFNFCRLMHNRIRENCSANEQKIQGLRLIRVRDSLPKQEPRFSLNNGINWLLVGKNLTDALDNLSTTCSYTQQFGVHFNILAEADKLGGKSARY